MEFRRLVDFLYSNARIEATDRFHGTFFYEICPLLTLAERFPSASAIQFSGSTSRCDGVLFFEEKDTPQNVELTLAVDGYAEALRMELLKRRGHAPGIQKIEACGNKGNRTFGENVTKAIDSKTHDHTILLPLIKTAIERKVRKSQTNQEYSKAWLAVCFDDWSAPNPSWKKERFDPLFASVVKSVSLLPFSRLFGIGTSRQYVFDGSLINDPIA
jgi:hypothetical protein